LIEACARLPLALTVVAARAATDPGLSVADLLTELRDERSRLDGLDAGDAAANLRTVFSWSYQALSPDAARAFRALGLHPGETFTASVLANLLGVETETARTMLTELHEAHLIEWHVGDRDTLHDLLRTYARDLARDGDDVAAATRRLVDYHLHTA